MNADAVDWVVFDLGGVVLTPTPELPALAALLGADPQGFAAPYSAPRLEYDKAGDAVAYWRAVAAGCGAPAPDHDLIAELTELDNRGWSHADPEMVRLITDLADHGARLAVLSNAPSSMGRRVEATSWASGFEVLLFSGDLRMVKPDEAIYRLLLARLASPADRVAFIDDRADNVEAAAAVGLHGHRHTEAARTRSWLSGLRSGFC